MTVSIRLRLAKCAELFYHFTDRAINMTGSIKRGVKVEFDVFSVDGRVG